MGRSAKKQSMLETCGLPNLQEFSKKNLMEETTEDAFNTKYYNSERRKKFTKVFGFQETFFTRALLPPTFNLIETIIEKYEMDAEVKMKNCKKYPWVNEWI